MMKMNAGRRGTQRFLLRLPLSVRRQAVDLASADGISLNQFISQAVAERVIRVESTTAPELPRSLAASTPATSTPPFSMSGIQRTALIYTEKESRRGYRLT